MHIQLLCFPKWNHDTYFSSTCVWSLFCFNIVCCRYLSCIEYRIISFLLAIAWYSMLWTHHGWFNLLAMMNIWFCSIFLVLKIVPLLTFLYICLFSCFLWVYLRVNYELIFSMIFFGLPEKGKQCHLKQNKTL